MKHNISEIDRLQTSIKGINNKADFSKISSEVNNFKSEIKSLGTNGKNCVWRIGQFTEKIWYVDRCRHDNHGCGKFRKKMITNVVELDTSLVELQKVSELSGKSLEVFTNRAF